MSTAAVVRGRPIAVEEVEARLARVRASGFGSRLPAADTAEGRNARRWVTQLLCAERLIEDELGPGATASGELTIDRALHLGGVAAAVLAVRPDAAGVVACPEVDEAAVRGYYQRNPDRYADRGVGYADARAGIATALRAAAHDRAFGAWLDRQLARDVELSPGFEHPADPHHADATHRH